MIIIPNSNNIIIQNIYVLYNNVIYNTISPRLPKSLSENLPFGVRIQIKTIIFPYANRNIRSSQVPAFNLILWLIIYRILISKRTLTDSIPVITPYLIIKTFITNVHILQEITIFNRTSWIQNKFNTFFFILLVKVINYNTIVFTASH